MTTLLEKYRLERGLTHEDIGARVKRSGRTVRRWEKRECVPDTDAMPKLVELIGPDVLRDFYQLPSPPPDHPRTERAAG